MRAGLQVYAAGVSTTSGLRIAFRKLLYNLFFPLSLPSRRTSPHEPPAAARVLLSMQLCKQGCKQSISTQEEVNPSCPFQSDGHQ